MNLSTFLPDLMIILLAFAKYFSGGWFYNPLFIGLLSQ